MLTRTVNDMYSIAKGNNTPLLSGYPSVFWTDYRNNYSKYDALFRRLYRSFKYFMQEDDESDSIVTSNFTEDVYNHLLINDKKYSELYRVNVVDDDEYHLLDNYDMSETMNRSKENKATDTLGQRTDSTTNNIGNVNEKTTDNNGSRTDKTDYKQGNQNNSTTTGIEGFNSASFSDSDHVADSIGQREDTTTLNVGEQNNTSTHTIDARTDTENFNKGEQNNSHNENETDKYTLTRIGNIGVITGTEMLEKHTNYWTKYQFYMYIFRDIAKELLLV